MMRLRHLLAGMVLPLGIAGFNLLGTPTGREGIVAVTRVSADTPPLVGQTPVVLPGAAGRFDFMTVDPRLHRLLAAHTGTRTLTVFDLAGRKLVKQVDTGAAQSTAVDGRDGKYFVGDGDDHLVAVVNSRTLAKTNEIKLTGPADASVYDPKNGMVYVDHDDGTEAWVIDAQTEKIVATIPLAGVPEDIQYDPVTDRLYQNVKTANAVQVIDPATNHIVATWKTAPATGPHGLVVDGKTHRLFSAGNNGKLAVLDTMTGKVVATVDIAGGVDQIAFDPAMKRIYCASGAGTISVVEENSDGATLLGNVTAPRGAHTLAVDPKAHAVWISYADGQQSCLMKFTAAENR